MSKLITPAPTHKVVEILGHRIEVSIEDQFTEDECFHVHLDEKWQSTHENFFRAECAARAVEGRLYV